MLSIWDSKGVFFVIRHKENLKFETLQERELPPKGAQNILKDGDIILSNPISKEKYPKKLRRVAVWDDENKQSYRDWETDRKSVV